MAELISTINFGLLFVAFMVLAVGFAIVLKSDVTFLKMLPLAWNGRRTIGFVVVTFGLDLCIKSVNHEILFPFSTFFLMAFLVSLGIMTVLGRPFLAQNLIPATSTNRIWLGTTIILAGVFGYVFFIFWIIPTLPFGLSSQLHIASSLAGIGLSIQFIRVVSQPVKPT